jgi:hypothetical protein
MKNKSVNRLLLVLSFVSFTFYGCQKEISDQNGSTDLTATVLSSKVNNWLDNQQAQSATGRKEKIQQLQQNLDFDKLHVETLNAGEQLIVVPVKNGYKTVNNKDKSVSNTAVFILDKSGTIRQGNVVQYAKGTADGDNSFPNNTITKIYNNQKIEGSGKFTLLSIYDKFEYELAYNSGSLQSTGYMQSKISANGRTSSCIAWYLVTTTFYSDGTQETTETFLGATCYESGCYPNDPNLQSLDCLEPGSGNGGEGGGLINELVTVDSVEKNLADSCFINVVNKITSANFKNQIRRLFNETYVGTGHQANLRFEENSNLTNADGSVGAAKSSIAPYTWVIELNPNYGNGSSVSEEYWGSVIIHELVHSFIRLYDTNNPPLSDFEHHEVIFRKWIKQMSDFMQQAFSMNENDAKALALGGLDEVLKEVVGNDYVFKQKYENMAQTKYGIQLSAAQSTRNEYKDGTKGLTCQ